MDTFQGFPLLLAMFYAEFHPTQGPQVCYQVPEGFTTPPLEPYLDFDTVSEYIIPKPELCNRLLSISTPHYKVLGYPVSIEDHERYERNAFIFNLCFVFDKNVETGCYDQVVRKLARILRSLEMESEFLSKTKEKMGNMMEQLLEDLNFYSECQIPINDANTINLKLFPMYNDPPIVYLHQVPIYTIHLENFLDKEWDLTIKRIVPWINGVNSVKRIAELADVRPDLVRVATQHLLYYGCVKMIDIFQFSNIYVPMARLNVLLDQVEAREEAAQFCTIPGFPLLSFATCFSLYCSLKHEMTVKEWIEENQRVLVGVDVRRFIIHGVLKGYIRRLHKYPMLVSPTLAYPSSDQEQQPRHWVGSAVSLSTNTHTHYGLLQDGQRVAFFHLIKYLDGLHHYDALCTLLGCSAKELDDILMVESDVVFILK